MENGVGNSKLKMDKLKNGKWYARLEISIE
jgi:hypothetical protein